jgi:hypothetical protein
LIGRTLPEFSSSFFDPYLERTHSTLGGFPPEVSSDQLGRIIGFQQQFSHRILAFEPVNRDCLLSALMILCVREKLSLIANLTRDWKIDHLSIPEFLLSFSRYRLLMAIPSADFAEIDDFCRNQNLDCQLISSKLRSGLNHFFIEGFADCGLDEIRAWASHGS